MATTYQIGQVDDASTEEVLFTIPAASNAKFKVVVANRDPSDATFRVAVAPDGVATANEHYVAYNEPIEGHTSRTSPVLTANANDVIRVLSSTANVTFGFFSIIQDE